MHTRTNPININKFYIVVKFEHQQNTHIYVHIHTNDVDSWAPWGRYVLLLSNNAVFPFFSMRRLCFCISVCGRACVYFCVWVCVLVMIVYL